MLDRDTAPRKRPSPSLSGKMEPSPWMGPPGNMSRKFECKHVQFLVNAFLYVGDMDSRTCSLQPAIELSENKNLTTFPMDSFMFLHISGYINIEDQFLSCNFQARRKVEFAHRSKLVSDRCQKDKKVLLNKHISVHDIQYSSVGWVQPRDDCSWRDIMMHMNQKLATTKDFFLRENWGIGSSDHSSACKSHCLLTGGVAS